jgi:hypothetical protein
VIRISGQNYFIWLFCRYHVRSRKSSKAAITRGLPLRAYFETQITNVVRPIELKLFSQIINIVWDRNFCFSNILLCWSSVDPTKSVLLEKVAFLWGRLCAWYHIENSIQEFWVYDNFCSTHQAIPVLNISKSHDEPFFRNSDKESLSALSRHTKLNILLYLACIQFETIDYLYKKWFSMYHWNMRVVYIEICRIHFVNKYQYLLRI